MEWWIFLAVFYWWWDEIISFFKAVLNGIFGSSDDESEKDEFEDYDFEEYYLKEDDFEEDVESDIEKPKNTIIKSNTNDMPTVTRVSGADLISKTVNRPTVINRRGN